MKDIFVRLLLVLPITSLLAIHENFKLPSRTNIIPDALVYVVQNIGYKPRSSFHISYSSMSHYSAHLQTAMINDFLLQITQDLFVSLDDICQFKRQRFSESRKFTLLLIDSEESFQALDPVLAAHQYDTSGKHLVLITRTMSREQSDSLIQKVFEKFFDSYIVNVELLLKNLTTGFMDIYTYFPVGPTYCFNVIPVHHNTFNGKVLSNGGNLFPHKFDNFFGCPLTVVTFTFPPHVFLKHHKKEVRGTGIDIKVLSGVAKKLNFTVGIIDAKQRGVQYPNGTLTGAIKILYENRANITIGGYGSAAKAMLLFSPSIAYFHTAMVFAIPPLQEYSPLERLLLPFDHDVWLVIGIIFGLTFFASVLLNTFNITFRDLVFGSTVKYPVFEMVVVYLGGGVARFPRGATARNVILQWLIVSLVLSSCYKAILFGMLKTGFLKKFPSTVEGMLNQGYVIDVPLPLMQNLKDGPLGNRDSFNLLMHSIQEHYEILQRGKEKRMVIDTNIQLQYFNSIFYEAGILHSLPQRLFIFPMYFYYRKESFLVEPINEALTKFIESGLITFWQNSVLNVSHLEKTQASNTMNPLLVKHFQGCFALCGVLIACSVAVFIFEIMSLRVNCIKKLLLCSFYSK